MTVAAPVAPAPRTPPGKVRSGIGASTAERVETYSDADYQRAMGLACVLGADGKVVAGAEVPALDKAALVALYTGMLRIRVMDERLLALQRQGRIGFYGEARGQEAAVIGSAAALDKDDYIVPALREAGAALYRGLPMRAYVAQILGNASDIAHGRQLPCHPGSRASRYVTMSSSVGTQIPHATGMAWAAKIMKEKTVVAGYMGDGATAGADFHVGVNFAGVYKVPVVFVCQNNQWAISTPVEAQSASETIAVKALAYGIPGVRVDGNDVLAVYAAMKQAVDRARRGEGPTLIEALTYRVSAHSSSDDPSRYRDESVTEAWRQKDPIARFRTYLLGRKVLTAKSEVEIGKALDQEVRDAIAAEEPVPPPAIETMIEDVFAAPTRALSEQLDDLRRVRAAAASAAAAKRQKETR